jgi:hypothetical protein
MDYDSGRRGWKTDDFSKNYFSPTEFRNAPSAALRVSDRYVWVYTERLNWWTGERVPSEYLQALSLARE